MRMSTLSVGSNFTTVENFNTFCLILKFMAGSSWQITHTCIQTCVMSAQTEETEIMHFLRSEQILVVSSLPVFCYLLSKNDKVMDGWGVPWAQPCEISEISKRNLQVTFVHWKLMKNYLTEGIVVPAANIHSISVPILLIPLLSEHSYKVFVEDLTLSPQDRFWTKSQ